VPRLYRSPPRTHLPQNAALSPRSNTRRASLLSASESWPNSARTSPLIPGRGLPAMRSPPPFHSSSITRSDWRPQLPSLPLLSLNGTAPEPRQRASSTWSEYALGATRAVAHTFPQLSASPFDPPPNSYHEASLSYGYQQPRGLSYSGPSSSHLSTHDRSPFSSNHRSGFSEEFPYPIDMNEMGSDSKQRKRRGNLPKETTDKLRAWFVAHLQHPYPTEDEKQELMRQTGLQMSE
jgi:hypothetical protein